VSANCAFLHLYETKGRFNSCCFLSFFDAHRVLFIQQNMASDSFSNSTYRSSCFQCGAKRLIDRDEVVGEPNRPGSLLLEDIQGYGVLSSVCRKCCLEIRAAKPIQDLYENLYADLGLVHARHHAESIDSGSDDDSSFSSASSSTDTLHTRFDALEKRVSVLERRQSRRLDMRRYGRLNGAIRRPARAFRPSDRYQLAAESPPSEPRLAPTLRIKIGKCKGVADRFEEDKSSSGPVPPPKSSDTHAEE